jgi:hypothetical protein
MNFIFYLIIGLFAEIATKHGGHCEPSTLLGGSEMDATHARQWAPSSVHPENLRGKIIINTVWISLTIIIIMIKLDMYFFLRLNPLTLRRN